MQPVGVLGGVDELQDAVLVDARGQRELHDVPGAVRVLVELAHDRLDLLLPGRRGQSALDAGDADLRAVAVLARYVFLAARVVTHEQRAEPGGDPPGAERLHTRGKL
jgi:hypothetical protein